MATHIPSYILSQLSDLSPVTVYEIQPGQAQTTRKMQFTFLAFFHDFKFDDASRIADGVHRESGGEVSVLLLFHRLASLKAKGDQKLFLAGAAGQGQLVLGSSDSTRFTNVPQNRDWEATRRDWFRSEAVASLYLEAAGKSRHLDAEVAKSALLHQAMQHLLVGIIRVFVGYRPANTNLRFLMDLCRTFTGLEISDPNDPAKEKLIALLMRHPAQLFHTQILEAPEAVFDELLESCQDFFHYTRSLALAQIQQPETIQF